MSKTFKKIVFAGDRDLSVKILDFMIKRGVKPVALLVSERGKETHAKELMDLCGYLPESHILEGGEFKSKKGVDFLNKIRPDYFINIHFPYIYPKEVLKTARYGSINLHPAYLPFGRGWNTPTWAILEGIPYGATLHFMDEKIDTGDIIHQRKINISPNDTAHTLYMRVKKLELEVFKEAWFSLLAGTYVRTPQSTKIGSTLHIKNDILPIQPIDLNEKIKVKELIDLLRALTSNDIKQAAYYNVNGKQYRVQIKISKET